jgi:hypothetical protein
MISELNQAYACMFSSVVWHPQWLILLAPFFAFSYYFINHKKIFFFFEILGAFAFIWITVNGWPNNVDAGMGISHAFLKIKGWKIPK